MMETYRSSVVCVLLCVVYSVISVKISATIETYSNNPATEVELSEYINGDNWPNTLNLYLDRLLQENSLPTLTLTNFKSLSMLKITNIPLENVPVFENISSRYLFITGTRIKHIPTNAFNGARVDILHLENNEIESMSNGSISKDVGELYLRCNKLSEFSQAWFEDPSTVGVLNLIGNRIESLEDQAFSKMTHLLRLDLSYNHIKRIGTEAFNSKIQHLYLQFCDIEQLTPDMFEGHNTLLYHLSLHHNQLSFLPEEVLVKLKPWSISLDGNPWQCQCLRDIERWIRERNIRRDDSMSTSRDGPTCVVPKNFVNVCVPVVDKELQQTYANGQSPVEGCLTRPCSPCV